MRSGSVEPARLNMPAVPATHSAFASFEQKWLVANPEQAAVAVFLSPPLRQRAAAFACLVHELEQAAFHLPEAQIASAKLAWWMQELALAVDGKSRHPITQTVFADAVVRAADPALWRALTEGALAQLDQTPAASLDELLAQFEPFHVAVAHAEATLFCVDAANIDANAALRTISHLLRELPQPAGIAERSLLPLNLLARHGVMRVNLSEATPARAALVKDHLATLQFEIVGALGIVSARTLGQCVRVRLDRESIKAALRAPDPLAILARRSLAGRWCSLWAAWREAQSLARRG